MTTAAVLDEPTFRRMVDDVFRRIDDAFAEIDPDLAESNFLQGTLTIVVKGKRLIVSPQPPVRQIWVAFKDRGWHLDFDREAGVWRDDRGLGLELFSLVQDLIKTEVGVAVSIARG